MELSSHHFLQGTKTSLVGIFSQVLSSQAARPRYYIPTYCGALHALSKRSNIAISFYFALTTEELFIRRVSYDTVYMQSVSLPSFP